MSAEDRLYRVGDAIVCLSFDRSCLTDRERLVFRLYYDQGYTLQEIEAITEMEGKRIPWTTVRDTLKKVKKKALKMVKRKTNKEED